VTKYFISVCLSLFCLDANCWGQFASINVGGNLIQIRELDPVNQTSEIYDVAHQNISVSVSLRAFIFDTSMHVTGTVSGDLGNVVAGSVATADCVATVIGPDGDANAQLKFTTNYQPGVHFIAANYTRCENNQHFTAKLRITVLPEPTPGAPSLIDPVTAHLITSSGLIASNVGLLLVSNLPTVQGVAADGITQVVVQVPASQAGQMFTLKIQDDTYSAHDDGGLADLSSQGVVGNTLTVTASGQPPLAVAVYRAPTTFARKPDDFTLASRKVPLQITALDTGTTTTLNVQIQRPPVVLVHGIWGDRNTWGGFRSSTGQLFTQDPRFFFDNGQTGTIHYDDNVLNVTASHPPMDANLLRAMLKQNALGYAPNAVTVLKQIRGAISAFKSHFNVAAVQADVVAHSMGGGTALTMLLAPNNFLADETYQLGYIDKLITIDTPYLGSPLANQLLLDQNQCTRNLLAANGLIGIQDVTISGSVAPVSGAIGDLQNGGAGSGTNNLPQSHPFPIAYIAGTADASNFANLDCTTCTGHATYIKLRCAKTSTSGDPIALNLHPLTWGNLFPGEPNNDAIVGLLSELNDPVGTVKGIRVFGVIHSGALQKMSFVGPSVLGQTNNPNVVDTVSNLLNEDPKGQDFVP
jgi:pimeloyl-ACP methyl ester carboxylesterase